ncbi:MAG: TonB-dependent receptor [Bacteroidota bacterium]|nr:TonB-dependent receptor [Bacteroidota bacterium]
MKHAVVYSWLLIFFCSSNSAQSQKLTEDTIARFMEQAVVTAQRKESQPLLVPYSVQKINQQQLDDFNPRTTPEALMMVNGVFVQKTNHGGGSPFVRGLTGNQVLLLVDGIRMNNSTFRYGPNQYLNTIDAYIINTIEVAKGTGSVQYGSDALGGVVQVLTKEPPFSKEKKNWTGIVLGKYMSGGMEKTGRGELHFSGKKIALQAGITYRNFGDLIGGDTTGKQSPSGYKELAADVKLNFLLNKKWQLILAHQSLQQQHVPVYHKLRLENFAINEMDPQKRMLNYARLKGNMANRFFKQIELTASWQHSIEGRNSRKNGSTSLRKERDEIITAGLTLDVASHLKKGWTANSGIELYHDKVGSIRKDINGVTAVAKQLRGLYPDDSKYGNYSLYSLQHFSFNKFIAEIGGRFNIFDIRISDTTLGYVKLTPFAVVGNAALLYQFSHRHSAYVSVSSGYRAPNVDDMGTLGIVDFRYEVPTDDLEPEKSTHTEVGYKFSDNKIKGSISLYQLQLQNIITRVKVEGQFISGYQVYQKENNKKARLKGIEAELSWQLINCLSIYGGFAYAQGENQTKHEPLRRVPPFNARMMTTYHKNKFFATAELMIASKQARLAQGDKDDIRIPAGGTPGWEVLNLYTGYKISKLQLNIGLQNMFDRDYRTHGSGINAVGRSAFISATINL